MPLYSSEQNCTRHTLSHRGKTVKLLGWKIQILHHLYLEILPQSPQLKDYEDSHVFCLTETLPHYEVKLLLVLLQ